MNGGQNHIALFQHGDNATSDKVGKVVTPVTFIRVVLGMSLGAYKGSLH